jgi:hypothetical protein
MASRADPARLPVALFAGLAPSGIARAADSSEFRPEANGFMTLGPQTRVILDGAYAQGKESGQASLDLATHLDVSLKPIRSQLQDDDWQRRRDTR